MTLTEYLAIKNITAEQFAASLTDASEGGVRKWMSGERIPRADQMREIVRVTNALVTPNDFYGVRTCLVEEPQS